MVGFHVCCCPLAHSSNQMDSQRILLRSGPCVAGMRPECKELMSASSSGSLSDLSWLLQLPYKDASAP